MQLFISGAGLNVPMFRHSLRRQRSQSLSDADTTLGANIWIFRDFAEHAPCRRKGLEHYVEVRDAVDIACGLSGCLAIISHLSVPR